MCAAPFLPSPACFLPSGFHNGMQHTTFAALPFLPNLHCYLLIDSRSIWTTCGMIFELVTTICSFQPTSEPQCLSVSQVCASLEIIQNILTMLLIDTEAKGTRNSRKLMPVSSNKIFVPATRLSILSLPFLSMTPNLQYFSTSILRLDSILLA